MDKLFIDFTKLDEHLELNEIGTGLGLSICKKIIEQMGGSVSVSSEVDVGSTFSINLFSKTKLQKVNTISKSINDMLSNSEKSQKTPKFVPRTVEFSEVEEQKSFSGSSQISEITVTNLGQMSKKDYKIRCIVANDDSF